jgi:hypothetical protein
VWRPERAQEDGVDVVLGDREAAEGIITGDATGAEHLDPDEEIDPLQLGAEVIERPVRWGSVAGSRHARTMLLQVRGAGPWFVEKRTMVDRRGLLVGSKPNLLER